MAKLSKKRKAVEAKLDKTKIYSLKEASSVVKTINYLPVLQVRRDTAKAVILRDFRNIDFAVVADNSFPIPANQYRNFVARNLWFLNDFIVSRAYS